MPCDPVRLAPGNHDDPGGDRCSPRADVGPRRGSSAQLRTANREEQCA